MDRKTISNKDVILTLTIGDQSHELVGFKIDESEWKKEDLKEWQESFPKRAKVTFPK